MNIIHIVLGKANPNRMNGVNKVVHSLATAQKELGYNVYVFGITNSTSKDDVERKYILKTFKKYKFSLDPQLVSEILSFSPKNTIFHIHGGFIYNFFFITRLLQKYNYRYIFTPHGSYNKEAMRKNLLLKKIHFKLFDSRILKGAWKVQLLGKSEYYHIDNLITGINKVLIPNGFDPKEIKFKFTKILSPQRPVFGYLGRIDMYAKGLDLLLEGFLKYKREGGKGILWIVGDGKDLPKLKSFVERHGLNQDVKFWGPKFGEEKYNILANMDVFIHTSRFEGFPMAILEAASLGLPLLVSKETNMHYYISNYSCGLVLDQLNPSSIKTKLLEFESIIQNKILYLSLKKLSVKMIREEFDWKKIGKHLIT